MYSIPVHGIGKNFLALHATRTPTFYSSFIPPAPFGQTTGSVFAVPKYSTLTGWTFKGYLEWISPEWPISQSVSHQLRIYFN
jgi:hypothetical protein